MKIFTFFITSLITASVVLGMEDTVEGTISKFVTQNLTQKPSVFDVINEKNIQFFKNHIGDLVTYIEANIILSLNQTKQVYPGGSFKIYMTNPLGRATPKNLYNAQIITGYEKNFYLVSEGQSQELLTAMKSHIVPQ
ncbi:MAG: hypothetical protein ACTSXG_03545, partial [Alphaproteobacteria bacterium]